MLTKINSACPYGLEGLGIVVEIDVAGRGLPRFDIIGLPNKAVDESRHRIKTALTNLKIGFPHGKKITVNLAPADVPKQGSFCDLPIAVGIICLLNCANPPSESLFFGEISLDGSLRHTRGALLMGLYAKQKGLINLFVPRSNAKEVASIPGLNVFPVENLHEVYEHILGRSKITPFIIEQSNFGDCAYNDYNCDIADIAGQEKAKRALEIAAAGNHNFLMIGPPGAGKTMLARSFVSIMPPLSAEESLEVTKIYSASGRIPPEGALIQRRPFRSPHHSISYAGMVGGGLIPQPGEISLAHRGGLFMDEFAEFQRPVLEMLRQPLEEGSISISRSMGRFEFPCRFTLLAACNPCPCGFFDSPNGKCVCTPGQIIRYRKKLSGPILDRIDLYSFVEPVDTEKLSFSTRDAPSARGSAGEWGAGGKDSPKFAVENSATVRARVIKARQIQLSRFSGDYIFSNGEMKNPHIRNYCLLGSSEEKLLRRAASVYGLSARSYFKTIKVARTIADLAGSVDIKEPHLAEALQYRLRPL